MKRMLMIMVVLLLPVSINAIEVELRKGNIGLLMVDGSINESVPATFVIDTGSTYNILGNRTFSNFKQEFEPTPVKAVRATIANGERIVLFIYRVESLTINDCVYNDVVVALNKTDNINIIGGNLLQRMREVTVNYDDLTMDIENCPR